MTLTPLDAITRRIRRYERRLLERRQQRFATVRVNGQRITLDLRDPVISRWLFYERIWEPYETSLLKKLLWPGAAFLDVGAHIGYYTLLAARKVGPRGKVLAFEPAPDNYALLRKNIAQNRLDAWVHAENAAVSDSTGEIVLYLSEQNNGDHRVYPTNAADDKIFNRNRPRAELRVPTLCVDEYLEQRGVPAIDVIKMDVQGAELSALKGMQATLARSPQVIILTEYWPHGLRQFGHQPDDMLHLLTSKAGMSLFYIAPDEKRIYPISPEELAAREFAPTLQVDLICSRQPDRLLATFARQ